MAKSDVWRYLWLKVDILTNKNVEDVALCRHYDVPMKYRVGTTSLNTHVNHHQNSVGALLLHYRKFCSYLFVPGDLDSYSHITFLYPFLPVIKLIKVSHI